MKMVTRILALMAIAILSSCVKDTTIPLPILDIQYTIPTIDLEGIDARFSADIFYDDFDLTNFDVFLPNSSEPTGLVIFIHGGGFITGDKSFFYNDFFVANIRDLLLNNIAVANINYRLLESDDIVGVIKPLTDSKRAIQYLRYFHEDFNIRKDDIILFGSSAGAGTALWLATNDDMNDSSSNDLINRESTRVKGIALRGSQSTYNFERWITDVFDDFGMTWDDYIDVVGQNSLFNIYGISSWEEYDTPEIDDYREKIDILALISSDDPEIWIQNTFHPNGLPVTSADINHHAFHAREIREYADAAGVAYICTYGNPLIYSDPSGETYVDFLIRKVKE